MAGTESVGERIEVGSRLAGRYRLEAIVGAGGMAVVWRAHDEALDRRVAVKVMSDALASSPAYVARFGREARIAAGITHPNLVAVHDFSATAERPYLVMQFVEGGTLEQRLARGRLDAPAAAGLARDLLSALGAVHARGVLHRDVKPANVLLDAAGPAKLTDFGVARFEDATALTQPGYLIGTLRFLAPELTRGAPPTVQSDLYALGVLLTDAVPAPAPAPLAGLIDALTREDPAGRPADAATALRQLEVTTPMETEATLPLRVPTRPANPTQPTRPLASTTQPTRIASRPRPAGHPAPGRGELRSRGLAATVLGLVLLAIVLIVASGGGGHRRAAGARATPAVGRPVSPGHLSLGQRLEQLRSEISAAPTR